MHVQSDNVAAKRLWKEYTEATLIPITLSMVTSTIGTRQASCNYATLADNAEIGLCDSDEEEDNTYASLELIAKINVEVRMFRKATDLSPFACKNTCPLKWWSWHAALYPSLT
jgi:hypothetical protein